MSFIYFTIKKLSQIKILRKERYFVNKIVSLSGVHYSTVAKKLNCVEGQYASIKA